MIDDWLSSKTGHWGARLQKMCEIEDLTLYAQTETQYHQALKNTGFTDIQTRSENAHYAAYNQVIVDRLREPHLANDFQKRFGQKAWQDAVEGYQLIADSIRDNELLIRWFKALKP